MSDLVASTAPHSCVVPLYMLPSLPSSLGPRRPSCQHLPAPGGASAPTQAHHAYLDHVPLLKLVENLQPLDARAVGGVQVSLRQTPVSGAWRQPSCLRSDAAPKAIYEGEGEKKKRMSRVPSPCLRVASPTRPPGAQCAVRLQTPLAPLPLKAGCSDM